MAGDARPSVEVMVGFIDHQCEADGVEPICRVLPTTPSTFYDHLTERADLTRLSDRARRDAVMRPEIERVIFEENRRVYGIRKVWGQLDREGFDVARYTVAWLIKGMCIQGLRHCPRTNGASMAQSAAIRTERQSYQKCGSDERFSLRASPSRKELALRTFFRPAWSRPQKENQ